MKFLAIDDGAAILLTFVVLIIIIGLSVVFFFLIKRNLRIEREEHEIIVENAITRNQMISSIGQYIKKVDRFGALTLMYIDIDGFSDLNEVFGEETCDQILKEMATRILRILPYRASLTRFENDEFLVFIRDEDNRDRIEKLADAINNIISNPYQVLVGESVAITASIGIVSYPQAGQNFDELYSNLQLTTYVSKRDGGNKFTNFYSSIKEEETDNMMYFKEVKSAIQNREFVLYYQPIVNLADKTLSGAEALMRWNHPTKGVQSPATFLKVLEQTGDIKWVGEWGIETMIRTHNALAEKFPTVPLRLSLNLSTKQMLDPNLANKFIDLMNKNNARADQYMLEISDFMMMEKIAIIKTNIYKLKDYGFKIAVDGFELDGQSVQAIQKSPIDVIKLGRNFLKDVENNYMKEKLLQILVKFAQDNNRTIISEGIETAEIAKYVKDQSVFYGQGYYFAKPMGLEAFEEYIEKKQYRLLLDEVSAIEDSEALVEKVKEAEAAEAEESADDFLSRIVSESRNQTEEAKTEESTEDNNQ